TLAAMVQQVNMERHDHIITLEDQNEYVIRSKNCHVSQREVFTHNESFAAALRAALREDPDVIMVCEMRVVKTFTLAMNVADTNPNSEALIRSTRLLICTCAERICLQRGVSPAIPLLLFIRH